MRIEDLRMETAGCLVRAVATVRWGTCGQPDKDIYIETEAAFAESFSCNPHAFIDGLNIYILDMDNRVLKQLTIPPDLLYGMGENQVEMDETLNNLPQFQNRIYPADLFFDALKRLGDDVRKKVIPQPGQLLRQPGHITRVDISDEVLSVFIELGIEVDTAQGRVVILMNGHEWAVWRLRSKLEGRGPMRMTNSERQHQF